MLTEESVMLIYIFPLSEKFLVTGILALSHHHQSL